MVSAMTSYSSLTSQRILVSRQHSIESDFEFPLKTLPSPHTASFQALSVNAFRWRIRDERPGDASKTFADHMTRNASAALNNEA